MSVPMEYLKINCLVVDDESSMRQTVKNMLSRLGFQKIVVADNGKKALDFINTIKIDLVICDVNMPEMTGTELFKTIRENKKHDNVIFIFVTAEASRQTVARAAEEGGEGYIIKPFVMGTLEDKIIKVLDKKFKPNPIDIHLKNFSKSMESREFDKAEEALTSAAALAPDAPAITYRYGSLALAKGDTNKAIERFKEVIDKNPLFVKAYNDIGEIYENIGDLESAIKYYELAHNISPANTDRLLALTKLYYKAGDTEKSEEMMEAAISDVRQDVSTSGHLIGEMYLAKNDNDKALEVLTKSHKKNPSDTSIMMSLSDAYRKVGQPQKAINMYKDIIAITPNNANAYYNMGKTFLEMGVKDKAIESIKKAWELNPFSKEIITDLKALAERDRFEL